MQFIDLKRQYEVLKDGIDKGIATVLAHGRYVMGPEIEELETKLAAYAGVKHAVACASGTDALLMPLMAWGIGPGDAVFVPAFTFFASAEAVALTGATPVFVDICADTFNMDPASLENAIQKTIYEGKLVPRAIMPVDLFGLPAPYDEINAVAHIYKLAVLEDAAQGFGGRYYGRVAGSLGDVGATSFFPAKPLGCYGDGGAMFTDDDGTAEMLRSIRNHGQGCDRYENVRLGLNGRLDSIQAAVLLQKLSVFDIEIEMRNDIAVRYSARLKDLVEIPRFHEGLVSTWAQYSVLAEDEARRQGIMEALVQAGIPVMIYYRIPMHLQKAFAGLGYAEGDMPVSEDYSRRIFSLPMHPYLTESEIDTIAAVIAANT
jgi:UDP-2-acetamido-2-deoxy-ribo-hexuluronate aminotransferase